MTAMDLPDVRLRQPAFDVVTSGHGLTSVRSMAEAFDVDVDQLRIAFDGDPVTPEFVAAVLIALPRYQFTELFQLDLRVSRPR